MSNSADVKRVFRESLGLPADYDVTTLAYSQHPNWDSVAHMQLVNAIERAFDIMLDTDDVIGMSSFPVAVTILKKYGVDCDA